MVLDNKYKIGQIVYLKTDPDQNDMIVTGINIRQTGLTYELSFGDSNSWHYDIEITKDRNVLKKCEN